ncbi:hypothetical protein SAMN05444266_101292 [Chitinophaga jiangningensis]|uniref:Uncharacterized protein n=1 Tax=Chitinophaga jiangningensis TaxID=1419482 RepID=A0A1M6VNR6_9BACT|nr:hypothetical protein [Chitinophaga jiangningensis]SHK83143.1 hypothetical protein SAMN05444266_101292 [Chitinophaga jiangningensis]
MDTEEQQETIWQRLRAMAFPISPGDGIAKRAAKNGAFYLTALMVGLVTLALSAAILFVL